MLRKRTCLIFPDGVARLARDAEPVFVLMFLGFLEEVSG